MAAIRARCIQRTVCATILAIKPYSGYYHCCVHCMGKLKESEDRITESIYWCRRCSQQYDHCAMTQRYCVAMTVSDHSSTTGTDVVLFGETLNAIFGLPATQLHKYICQKFPHEIERMDHLSEALRCVLVGQCVLLSFPRQAVTAGSGQPLTLAGLKRRSSAQIIASGVRVLGNHGQGTVLVFLENSSVGREGKERTQPLKCETLVSQKSNWSSFYATDTQPESGSSGQGVLLETYCEGSSSSLNQSPSTQLPRDILPSPPSLQQGVAQAGHNHSSLVISSDLLVQKKSQSSHEIEDNVKPSPTPLLEDDTLNESVLHELITDWECSQHGSQLVSPNVSLAESELHFSEDVLRELQLNFDPTPPSQVKSQHSLHWLNRPAVDSPDLFSTSASSDCSCHFESPELFDSTQHQSVITSDSTSHLHTASQRKSGHFNHTVTPSSQRTRHFMVKRTLLHEKRFSTPHPLTERTRTSSGVCVTPKERVAHTSRTPNALDYTPDLL